MSTKLGFAIAVLVALPLIVLRGRTRLRCLASQAGVYVVALFVSRQIATFDMYLATVALLVVQLVVVSLFLATAAAEEVRWSANRAGVVALLVYALMIPAMLRTPIDGDEPFYLLITESIVHDRDLNLANQYRDLAHSATGRTDLRPQLGDPVGGHGEQPSRHEPFLPLLLVPGYFIGRLAGAIATIALFGALLVRSTVRLLEDEGIDDATARAVFPLFAFGPPILFYSARIWPEVPAAFFFVETIRGVRARAAQRWIPAVFALTLIKLRFILVAVPLIFRSLSRRTIAVAAVAIIVPLVVVWFVSGSPTSVHSWRELLPVQPRLYTIGFFGLILDGAAGILFQAPFYLLGVLALARWRDMPGAYRLGMASSLIYIVTLVPRAEWHGGWSPPLRYIVFLMPVLALGAAAMWKRVGGGTIALITLWTAGLVVHGIAYPWRLFHIENGENVAGEALSRMFHSDFSRLFPSFIRPNDAAWIASWLFVVMLIVALRDSGFGIRDSGMLTISIVAALLAAAFIAGQQPGSLVEFEDAHVIHKGGELYPPEYTVARFLYRGGWIVRPGDSLSFLARGGTARLEYSSAGPALIELAGRAYHLDSMGAVTVDIPRTGRVLLRCVSGTVNLDRLE
ncbi:MAG TPA: hypothetical protein VLV78_22085 [Thermoanaerobaculia bacterium]|nr:hypothetical protein [Thermoanaerobaculia bacterium]